MFESWRFKYKCGDVLRFSDSTIIKILSITHKTDNNQYYYDVEMLYDPTHDNVKKADIQVNLLDGMLTLQLIHYYNYNNVWNELNG